jgi:hypothetical protein
MPNLTLPLSHSCFRPRRTLRGAPSVAPAGLDLLLRCLHRSLFLRWWRSLAPGFSHYLRHGTVEVRGCAPLQRRRPR